VSVIGANILHVRERIAAAAGRIGRDPGDICLIAVSKTIGVEAVRSAVEAGIRDFGENYVQEAMIKIGSFGSDIRWHFIGHLQTNKARQVVGAFALVHSVDSDRIAVELNKRALAAGIVQDVLIEVRLDPEGAKTGVEPDSLGALADCVGQLPGLRLRGLMGIAPVVSDPDHARPHFARLRGLLDCLPPQCRAILSMGMTGDFEPAIMEGATHVRIGTAIFGPRS